MAVGHRFDPVVTAIAVTVVVGATVTVARRRHRGRARELLALGLVDQLVVGHALLVQARALFVELRLGTLGLGFLLGDPCALLGLTGLALARFGLGSMLIRHASRRFWSSRSRFWSSALRRMRGNRKATTARMISTTTTIAIIAPVVIGNLL